MSRRSLILVVSSIIVLLLAVIGYDTIRWRFVRHYEMLRASPKAIWVDASREQYDEWVDVKNAKDRQTMYMTADAYTASRELLPAVGLSGDIEGYLSLLTMDMPRSSELSFLELMRWIRIARLRDFLAPLNMQEDAPLYVYRINGEIQAYSIPDLSQQGGMHLGFRENNTFGEYISLPPKEHVEGTD